jgi:protein-tyrosine phosphatase
MSVSHISLSPGMANELTTPSPPVRNMKLASSSTISLGVAPTRLCQAFGSEGTHLNICVRQHCAHHTCSLDTARSLRFIADKGITAVLSVCNDFVPAEDPVFRIMHHRIPIEDAPTGVNLLVELPVACGFIHAVLSHGGRVLVHSVRGQNRAPAVVAAYRKLTFSQQPELSLTPSSLQSCKQRAWMLPNLLNASAKVDASLFPQLS